VNGLCAFGQIDDAEAGMPQTNPVVDIDTHLIGTPVSNDVRHLFDELKGNAAGCSQAQITGNTAHE
jgi:hypothetical protein